MVIPYMIYSYSQICSFNNPENYYPTSTDEETDASSGGQGIHTRSHSEKMSGVLCFSLGMAHSFGTITSDKKGQIMQDFESQVWSLDFTQLELVFKKKREVNQKW